MKRIILLLLAGLAACEVGGTTAPPIDPSAPTHLSFQLSPSGDPNVPLGILLTWVAPSNGRAVTYDVYGRTGANWLRRATTTSTSFHDIGVPQSEYYVAAVDAQSAEIGRSATIVVDLATRLPAPLGLTSITLNGAIQLSWTDNAVQAEGSNFDHYRIYSSEYSSARTSCIEPWYFEGSTVSDAFIVGNLTNGLTRCFAVSAISTDGHESTWSNARIDTPRLDARSVLVYVADFRSDSAAFVFNDEVTKKFGVIGATTRTDADFTVSRISDGTLWMTPARNGSAVVAYATTAIPQLSTIDRAPLAGYQTTTIQASPGMGYVFRLNEADGTHYGAIRVQFVAKDFIVFDWAYQIGIGNPELLIRRR